jgi:hypothetical protein
LDGRRLCGLYDIDESECHLERGVSAQIVAYMSESMVRWV